MFSWRWISFVVTVQEYLEYWPEKGDKLEARLPKSIFRRCKKKHGTLKHDPECILKWFYELVWWFNGIKKEKINIWRIITWQDHQDPKNKKNVLNCSNHISKDSRSMFVRQLYLYFYIVNKVVKQIKMTTIWVKFVPTSLTED